MKKIVVYSDLGVGPLGLRHLIHSLKSEPSIRNYSIQRSGKKYFEDPSWVKDTALLIFPGGRDVYYHEALKGMPNLSIYDYVSSGGKYLGICAGGYYGAKKISFEQGNLLEVLGSRELAFFPGEARGPVYGKGLFRYEGESGSKAANLNWTFRDKDKGRKFTVYFNGGCEFVNPHKYANVKILARYDDLPSAPAAIVECLIGKGKVVLSGVHPEYSPKFIDHKDPYLTPIHKRLEQGDPERQRLFAKLLARLL